MESQAAEIERLLVMIGIVGEVIKVAVDQRAAIIDGIIPRCDVHGRAVIDGVRYRKR